MLTAKETLEREIELKEREIFACREMIASVVVSGYSRREKEVATRIVQNYLNNAQIGKDSIQGVLDKLS